jgi:ribose/xylose/arabinose/galactoside ABC-type transport system permease subunit
MSETKDVLPANSEDMTTSGAIVQSRQSRLSNIRWDVLWERYGIAAVLLVIWLISFFVVPNFSDIDNFTEVLRQSSFVGIASVGMTIVILLGSFDLSIGSTLALCAWLVIMIASRHELLWAFVATLLLGSFIGVINGFLIAFVRIPAFIVTLSMLFIISGYTFVITGGNPDLYTGQEFTQIGGGDLLGIPIPFIVFVICALLGAALLRYTPFGRHVYAAGSNAVAARIAGVPVRRTQFYSFVLVGLFTAGAAILLASRLYTAGPDLEPDFELNVIATVVLGGTRLSGGRGSMLGTFAAALLFTTIGNILDLLSIDAFVQRVIVGLVLLVALSIEGIRARLAERQ